MKPYAKPDTTVIVIFGAGGDLAWRKLMPALYDLWLDEWTPEKFRVLGVDAHKLSNTKFLDHLREGVGKFSRAGKVKADEWKQFAGNVSYLQADLGDKASYKALAEKLDALDDDMDAKAQRVFYLALPPSMIQPVGEGLSSVKLARQLRRDRLVVEKPFGHDLDSARELNGLLTKLFDEDQIFRIDHFLGKETVQNILALRFGNSIFEPIWNQHYVDHVQITVAETLGIGHRGPYYDKAGALRDMVQNHLMQLLCMVAMEPAVGYTAHEIRDKKVEILRAIREIHPDQVGQFAVRGQYREGWIKGEHVRSYRDEDGIDDKSDTESFAAVKFLIDTWRWQGVPFYMRTGKRLPVTASEIVVQFRPAPHLSFPLTAMPAPQPNRLVIRIQPDEGIVLRFQAKQPGETMRFSPVDMDFSYRESFDAAVAEAYSTLLMDVMLDDPTQFMRADQVEYAWAAIQPILEVWQSSPTRFPDYAAGTWGPESASALIAQDGRSWIAPSVTEDRQDE